MLEEMLAKCCSSPGEMNGEDDYSKSAVMLLLVEGGSGYEILFEKRSVFIRQPGEISFPGGKFNPLTDNTYLDTAFRETEEETGLSRAMFSNAFSLPAVVAPMGAMVYPFVAFAGAIDFDCLVLDSREVEEAFTLPLDFFIKNQPEEYSVSLSVNPFSRDGDGRLVQTFPAADLGLPEKYHSSWGSVRHRIYLYKTCRGPVWGITGRIIYDFVRRLKAAGYTC